MWTRMTLSALLLATTVGVASAADVATSQPAPNTAATPATPFVCPRCGLYCIPGYGRMGPLPAGATTQPAFTPAAPNGPAPAFCPFYGYGGRGPGRMGGRGWRGGPRDGFGPRRDGSCFWSR